jgi:hypothetical protein
MTLGVSTADLSDAGLPSVVALAEALSGAFIPVARRVHVIHTLVLPCPLPFFVFLFSRQSGCRFRLRAKEN